MDEGPDDEILRVEGFVVDAKGRWNKTSTVLMVAAKPSPPPWKKKLYKVPKNASWSAMQKKISFSWQIIRVELPVISF